MDRQPGRPSPHDDGSGAPRRPLARVVPTPKRDEARAPKRRRADYLPLAIPAGNPEATVDVILAGAIATSASDIHLESDPNGVAVRFRIHGILQAVGRVPIADRAAVISRIKILSNLDISERRLPQDGRIKLPLDGNVADLRVAVTPSMHGESAVLRVLDLNAVALPLSHVGMPSDIHDAMRALCHRPQGLVFVTGPTGSGKTSTIYGCLNEIKGPHLKVITIEDPIEYEMDNVTQIAVHEKIGLTFASCLRSALRQDPEVIVVGEIRDEETARIAMQASLTGHLVFSTLHTNSAIGAIPRLIDMGVPPYLITSAVSAVLAQRLLRVMCPGCKEPWDPPGDVRQQFGVLEWGLLYRARGCDRCLGTGTVGRTGIFELLTLTPALCELISRKASEIELRREAQGTGYVPMFTAGLARVQAGEVAGEELTRVVTSTDAL